MDISSIAVLLSYACVFIYCSYSSIFSRIEDKETARYVFTDASIKLSVQEVIKPHKWSALTHTCDDLYLSFFLLEGYFFLS